MSPPAALQVLQWSGRAFAEGPQAGDRFQGRVFIWSLEGPEESVLGPDVSLFDSGCVAKFGRGVQCAHLLVVVNGFLLEAFDTSSPDFIGHLVMRTSSTENARIFLDPAPDGTRSFDQLASFEVGEPVAVYKVREFLTIDPVLQVGGARNSLELVESKPFTLNGVTIDFKDLAPRLTGTFQVRFPEPQLVPQPIPVNEPPFGPKGSGFFLFRIPVSGAALAVGSK